MHIPDGYLSPGTCAVFGGAMLPVWAVSAWRLSKRLGTREVPMLGLASAFSFVVMMFNVPAPGGTTGHPVGSGLVAILLGPAAAVVTTSVALAIQALIFGDGGILTFGANCFNMAFVAPIVTFAVFRLLTGKSSSLRWRAIAAGVSAYVGLNLAALAAGIELGAQPLVAHTPEGMPLYCPYTLGVSVPGMLLPHLIVFGLIEASATAGVVAWALRSGFSVEATAKTGAGGRLLWGALALLCLLSPLGLLATGDAWGEWDPDKLKERVGFTPTGVGRLADSWHGALKDYTVPGWDAGTKQAVGYVISAVVGVLLVAVVTFVVGRLLARRRQSLPGPPLAREHHPAPAPFAPPASEIDGPKAPS